VTFYRLILLIDIFICLVLTVVCLFFIKVHILLLLQLENGTTYSYAYNGRPIESHILNGAIFNDLEPPLPQFQGRAILWRWMSHKRFDIRSFNEKLIGIYTRPVLNSVISNDLEWSWVTWQNIQWHEVSRGLSATAELLVLYGAGISLRRWHRSAWKFAKW